jgi:hypothetical protein
LFLLMNSNDILNQLTLESEMVAIALLGLAILLILVVNRKRLQVRLREWRIQRSLRKIGCEQLRNLVCSDGLDGYVNIDRLALLQDAILVITYKPYGGNIYCAERISEWTQVVDQKSFKFDNPLFELENQLTSLRLLVDNTPLRGYLFFNHSAEFPKGHPDSVLHPGNIPESFVNADPTTIKPEIRASWEQLKSQQNKASDPDGARVKT